jgi:capsular polysaccharide export protein
MPSAPDRSPDRTIVMPDEPPIVVCAGVAGWKRKAVGRLVSGLDGGPPRFTGDAALAIRLARSRNGAVGVWPSRAPRGLTRHARAAGVPVVRIEDGFIRSSGLGAQCHPPASVVLDRTGMHFDPSRPSDLENLLADSGFGSCLLERSHRLIQRIVDLGVTKYNMAGDTPCASSFRSAGRRIVLVVGQVEDDLSVRLGGAGVAGNLDLLRRARAAEPASTILYRPHPDVEAGHRKGLLCDHQVLRYADHVVRGHALPALLSSVDAVHVLTSLTGFEALLRGREVVAHGQPFYAGWGLTRDLAPPPRRGRRLSLVELAAAALILYPRYIDPRTGEPCSPEALVACLGQPTPPRWALLPWCRQRLGEARRAVALHRLPRRPAASA